MLFVCLGNSCRSPMAEGFARAYGSDVLVAQSAGFYPARIVQPLTRKVMLEKNIDLSAAYPKPLEAVKLASFDVIVNMAAQPLPAAVTGRVEEWKVPDPIGLPEPVYREVANQIEQLVMRLILNLRAAA